MCSCILEVTKKNARHIKWDGNGEGVSLDKLI